MLKDYFNKNNTQQTKENDIKWILLFLFLFQEDPLVMVDYSFTHCASFCFVCINHHPLSYLISTSSNKHQFKLFVHSYLFIYIDQTWLYIQKKKTCYKTIVLQSTFVITNLMGVNNRFLLFTKSTFSTKFACRVEIFCFENFAISRVYCANTANTIQGICMHMCEATFQLFVMEIFAKTVLFCIDIFAMLRVPCTNKQQNIVLERQINENSMDQKTVHYNYKNI